MLCGKMASNCWSHETFPAWKQTVSFTAHSSLIYSVHWKMSLKKKEKAEEKSQTTTSQVHSQHINVLSVTATHL